MTAGYKIELSFADKLFLTRRILGRQKIKVAEAVGVSDAQWRSFERGEKIPSKPTMKRLEALTSGYIHVDDDNSAAIAQVTKEIVTAGALSVENPFAALMCDSGDGDRTHEVFENPALTGLIATKVNGFARKYPEILERARAEGIKLPEAWGVTAASISYWKSGIRNPSPDKVALICERSFGLLTPADFVVQHGHEKRGRGRPRQTPLAPGEVLLPPPPKVPTATHGYVIVRQEDVVAVESDLCQAPDTAKPAPVYSSLEDML